LVKISMLLYYRRIFVTRTFIVASRVLIGLLACFTLSINLGIIFSKWPVPEQWNPESSYRINISAILIAFIVGNALFDIAILSLPLMTIRNLQMNSQRKLILSTIFSLGSSCVVVSLLRLVYAVEYVRAPETSISFFEVPFIYNDLMALIELPVFIIAACFLTLGPLFRAKYGPSSLFRSLRSRLLSNLSKRRGTSRNLSTPNIDSSDPITEDRKHPWRRLHVASDKNGGSSLVELSHVSIEEENGHREGTPPIEV